MSPRLQLGTIAFFYFNILLVLVSTVHAADTPLGPCNEILKDDTEQYPLYVKKKYHPLPSFSYAINPAWKKTKIPGLNDVTLTINTDLTFVDDPKYVVHMDSSDHGDNLFYQFVIKMSLSGNTTRLITPTSFLTCVIRMQDIKDTPKWSYLLDPFTYTKTK